MPKSQSVNSALKKQRGRIDQLDRAFMRALGARFAAVKKIGAIKIAQGLPLLQKTRWAEVMSLRLKTAKKVGMDSEFTQTLFKLIHKEALRIQRELANKTKKRRNKK